MNGRADVLNRIKSQVCPDSARAIAAERRKPDNRARFPYLSELALAIALEIVSGSRSLRNNARAYTHAIAAVRAAAL